MVAKCQIFWLHVDKDVQSTTALMDIEHVDILTEENLGCWYWSGHSSNRRGGDGVNGVNG